MIIHCFGFKLKTEDKQAHPHNIPEIKFFRDFCLMCNFKTLVHLHKGITLNSSESPILSIVILPAKNIQVQINKVNERDFIKSWNILKARL